MTNEFAKASDEAYWAWSYKHLASRHRELEIPRTCFNAGFYLGAQYAIRTSGAMSPHLARFLEFVMWLTERSDDSTTSSTKRGSSSTENKYGEEDEYGTYCTDPNGYAVLQAHHLQGHRTELRNDDSVFCLDCGSTIAVADG